MIKEDYCSYEVAKLLKEKGFEGKCTAMYDKSGCLVPTNFKRITNSEKRTFVLDTPTHQMAMKWLREVHLLFIDIDPLTCYKWSWSIWFMNDPKQKVGESPQTISTYEKACEAAIKYCLELLYDYRRLC